MATSLPFSGPPPSFDVSAHLKYGTSGEVSLNEMSAGSSSGTNEAVSIVLEEIDKRLARGERIVEGSQVVSCLRLLEMLDVLDRPTEKELFNRWFSRDYALGMTFEHTRVEEMVRMLHDVCGVEESEAIALVESVKVMRPCVSAFDVACVGGRSAIASRPGHWVAWIRENGLGRWHLAIATCVR